MVPTVEMWRRGSKCDLDGGRKVVHGVGESERVIEHRGRTHGHCLRQASCTTPAEREGLKRLCFG